MLTSEDWMDIKLLKAQGLSIREIARTTGRILAVRELDSGEPPLTVVVNWRRLLEKE